MKQRTSARGSVWSTLCKSAFFVPSLVVALALPFACSTSQHATTVREATMPSKAIEIVPFVPNLDDGLLDIDDKAEWIEQSLADIPDKIKEELSSAAQASLALLADSREKTADCTYVVSGDHGWGSGTAIACIPILVPVDEEATPSISPAPPHVPWVLDPSQPEEEREEPQAVGPYRTKVAYLVIVLTARHVVEFDDILVIPAPEQRPNEDGTLPPQEPPTLIPITRLEENIFCYNANYALGHHRKIVLPTDYPVLDIDEDAAIVTFVSDKAVPTAIMQLEPTRIGQDVYKAGFGGRNQEFWCALGLICDPDGRASAPIIFGDSGGALYNQMHSLVGITVAVEVVGFQGHPVVMTTHCMFVPIHKIVDWVVVSVLDTITEDMEPILRNADRLELVK